MTLVGTRVYGNPMASRIYAYTRKLNRVWVVAFPRVSQQGDLVEINA